MTSRLALILVVCLVSTLTACDSILRTGPVSLAWSASPPGRYVDTSALPSTDGTRVFFLGEGVLALDAGSGARLWEARPFETFTPRFSVAHSGTVFVGTAAAVALDAATGTVRWRSPVPNPTGLGYARPDADGTAFYTLSNDGHAYAFEHDTGAVRWRVDLADGWWGVVSRGATVAGGVVYVALERRYPPNGFLSQGVVVALDAQSGTELWRHVNGDGSASVGIADRVTPAESSLLYADFRGQAFVAVDRATGLERWRVRTQDGYAGPFQSPVVVDGGADGLAYASAPDIHVRAIELATGRVRWSREPAPDASGSLYHAACGSIVLNNAVGVVYALDRQTGRTAGNDVYRRDSATSGFAVGGKRAFFVGRNSLVALNCP